MKILSPLVVAASLLACSTFGIANAQETAPATQTGVATYAPATQPPRLEPEADEKPTSLDSKLVRYLVNPFGEVDELLLDGGKTARVPPHMGAALTASLKAGDPISVQGRSAAEGTIDAFSVTNTETKQVVLRSRTDFKLPHWFRTMRLSSLKASSKIVATLNGPRGEPNGVVLEDGTVVRLGPNGFCNR